MSPKHALPRPKSIVGFRILLALAGVMIISELILLWSVPYLAKRYQLQLERAKIIRTDPYLFLREHESLRMIPPAIGVMYRRQVAVGSSPKSKKLFDQLLRLDDAARIQLLKQVDEQTFLGVLDRCYGGEASQSQLEEFLVRAVAQKQLPDYTNAVYVKLSYNYYRTAQRSQYAGLIDEARRGYRRFVELVRILNKDSPDGAWVHYSLNRANVRLKIMSPEQAFETQAVRKIQTGSAKVMQSFLSHPDARLAGLARFNAASVLWHVNNKPDEAARLLEGHLPACGPLAIECKFLLAKINDSLADADRRPDEEMPMSSQSKALAQKARSVLDQLIRELPNGHPLLDDIYFYRANVAAYRGDRPGAQKELGELRRRCPNTDLLSDVRVFEKALTDGPITFEE